MPIITLNSDLLHILRDQESRETNSHLKAMTMSENNHEVTVKSNGSDCSYVQSVESSSVGDMDSTLSPEEVETMVKLQHFSYLQCSIVHMVQNSCPCMHIGT
jgi:hypothetical protein